MSLHRPTKEASSPSLGHQGHLKDPNNSANTDSAAGCQSVATGGDLLQVKNSVYKVGKKLGEGTFGIVYAAIDLSNHRLVAIKFERCEPGKPQLQVDQKTQLQTEYEAYGNLKGSNGIPNVYYFGRHGLHNILILDRLGPSLEDLFDRCERKFTLKTVVMIGKQMISRVEVLHRQGLIHRDIKPENFLIDGPGTKHPNKVFLIDPAMAENYRCSKTGKHIPPCEGMDPVGTARYMSIKTHLRKQQSRRDDLEAIFYVLLYFMRGGLPWQGLKGHTKKDRLGKILEIKQQTSVDSLCGAQSAMFVESLEYVRELGFKQDPDYDYLRCCLTKALEINGEAEDDRYDWGTWSLSTSPLPSPSASQTSKYVGSTDKSGDLSRVASGSRLGKAKDTLAAVKTGASHWLTDPLFTTQFSGPKSQSICYNAKAQAALDGIFQSVGPFIRQLRRHQREAKRDLNVAQLGITSHSNMDLSCDRLGNALKSYDKLLEALESVGFLSEKASWDFLRKASSDDTVGLKKGLNGVGRLVEDCLQLAEQAGTATFSISETSFDIDEDSELPLEVDETYAHPMAEVHQQTSVAFERRGVKGSRKEERQRPGTLQEKGYTQKRGYTPLSPGPRPHKRPSYESLSNRADDGWPRGDGSHRAIGILPTREHTIKDEGRGGNEQVDKTGGERRR